MLRRDSAALRPQRSGRSKQAVEILVGLAAADSAGRLLSARTGEWMYVFKPRVAEMLVYVKLVLRADCIVVSFHEEEDDRDPEDDT